MIFIIKPYHYWLLYMLQNKGNLLPKSLSINSQLSTACSVELYSFANKKSEHRTFNANYKVLKKSPWKESKIVYSTSNSLCKQKALTIYTPSTSNFMINRKSILDSHSKKEAPSCFWITKFVFNTDTAYGETRNSYIQRNNK